MSEYPKMGVDRVSAGLYSVVITGSPILYHVKRIGKEWWTYYTIYSPYETFVTAAVTQTKREAISEIWSHYLTNH